MMKVLVTGGHGFVGHHIVNALLTRGHEVGVIDNRVSGVELAPKERLFWDSKQSIAAANSFPHVDVIVHAAARADIADNWKSRAERENMWHSNFDGTLELLEAARQMPKFPRIVFISTCAVYGKEKFPTEETPCAATSPYAASKLAGEALVQTYCHAANSDWYVLRLGNVVGSDYHHGHIADFVRMAKQDGKITARSKGTWKKSYVHVEDVADVVSAAAFGVLGHGIYNCVSGLWSVRDTAAMIGVEATWGKEELGWIGDPFYDVSNKKLMQSYGAPPMQRSIVSGVADAIRGLGWVGGNNGIR